VHLSPTPIRPDSVRCHCDLPVARLVWRISRLGDKIKLPIDLIRPFSNTPDSVCFLTLSLLLRSAYELPVIVFMLYNIRKHVVSFGCPRVGLSPAGFDSVDPSRSTSRGCPLPPSFITFSVWARILCHPKFPFAIASFIEWTSAPIIYSQERGHQAGCSLVDIIESVNSTPH